MSPAWILALLLFGPGAAQDQEVPVSGDYRIEGNRQVSARQLRRAAVDELTDLASRGYRPADADDAAFRMETWLIAQGYARARVDYRIEETEGDRRVRFLVAEGPRFVVEELQFEGNEAFPGDELAKLSIAPTAGMFTSRQVYDASDLSALPVRIRRLYRTAGYLDARVAAPEITIDEQTNTVRARFQIHEGVQYLVTEVELEGYSAIDEATLREGIADILGKSHGARRTFELRSRLEALYGNQGYASARIDVEETGRERDGSVRVRARIIEGPRVTIGDVRIQGNDKTREGFVRNRLHLEPGDTYSRQLEQQSSRRLYQSGLFELVDIDLEGEGPTRDLLVDLREAPSRELSFTAGYGSYESLRGGVGYRQRNLFGTGRGLGAEGSVSMVGENGLVSFTDPWFLGSSFTLEVPIHFRRREEPSFTRKEYGGALRLGRQWTRRFSTTVGYEMEKTTSSDIDVTAPPEFEEDARVGATFLEMAWDTRDDLFNPSRGNRLAAQFRVSDPGLGGDIAFFNPRLTAAQYLPVTEKLTLALGARTGIIVPYGDTDEIPLQLRMFNGGQDTVRSYDEAELGPKDVKGEPVGGEAFTVLSVELRYALTRAWQVAAFYDTGNVAFEIEDYIRDYRHGLGLGIRYLLPIGAIRLDGAVNPDPRDHDPTYRAHLSVGLSF